MGPRRSAEAPAALPERMQAWLAWLATQRRVSPLTLTAYRAGLQALLRLAEEHPPESFAPPTSAASSPACMARASRGARSPAICRRGGLLPLVGARARRAHQSGARHPSAQIPLDAAARALAEQANALLDPEPQNLLKFPGYCDVRAFFYSSGLRVAELAGLDFIDSGLDLAEGWSRSPASASASAPCRWAARRSRPCATGWRSARRPRCGGRRALFVTRDGHRLSTRGIASRLGTRAQALGLNDACASAHAAAHSFCESSSAIEAAIFALSRNCSATPASAARRSTRISISSISPRC